MPFHEFNGVIGLEKRYAEDEKYKVGPAPAAPEGG
jgi:hypothetical protein